MNIKNLDQNVNQNDQNPKNNNWSNVLQNNQRGRYIADR